MTISRLAGLDVWQERQLNDGNMMYIGTEVYMRSSLTLSNRVKIMS